MVGSVVKGASPRAVTSHLSGFRQFILRGSVIDLAVGIIIGAAFESVVSAVVKDLFTPLIAAIFGKPDFSNLAFTINNSTFKYGDLINQVISLLIIAAVLFYFIVLPYSAFRARFDRAPDPEPSSVDCPFCLSRIPAGARKCAFCGTDQPAVAGAG